MKKSLLLITCFVLILPQLNAQQSDPLVREIETHTSLPVRISNGRQMFLEEILAGNERKAGEVRDYLTSQVQGTSYVAFSVIEYFLSLYWTRDYGGVLGNSAMVDSLFSSTPRESFIPPARDELALKLPQMSTDSLQMLEERVDGAMLNLEERDYLKIVLRWLVAGEFDFETLREISVEARAYLTDYPSTPHKSFLNKFVVYEFEASKWGYGYAFGIGPVFLGGPAKNYFNSPVFGVTFVFDALYRRLYMGAGLLSGSSGLNCGIAFRGYDFTSEDHMNLVGVDLRLGYKVLDTPRFALVPYGAIGGSGLTIKRKGDDDYSKEKGSLTYGGGIFMDIKFPFRKSPLYRLTGQAFSYSSLRLRYHLTSANYSIPGAGNSLIQWFTIEWGGLTRTVRRVQY